MKLTNRTYDILKWIALVFLPAVQVLWLGLGKIWGFPYLVEIGASIACVDVFIGSLIGVSNMKYNAIQPIDVEDMEYLEDEDVDDE